MKKRFWAAAAVFAMLLIGSAAWADFYVIAGGGAVGTKIISVPYTISTPGFYYLGGNLTHSGDGNAITVSADNVTLDLMGFRLHHEGDMENSYGVYMSARTNVEVRNGTVSGFFIGIAEVSNLNGNKHRAIDIRATNTNTGIWFYGKNHLIKNCNGSNNSNYGLYVMNGMIADCVAADNNYGIAMEGPGSVTGNTARNNQVRNFSVGSGGATSILVDRNSAFGLTPNYYIPALTTGVTMGTNAGAP
jgi:hypothetical protein